MWHVQIGGIKHGFYTTSLISFQMDIKFSLVLKSWKPINFGKFLLRKDFFENGLWNYSFLGKGIFQGEQLYVGKIDLIQII